MSEPQTPSGADPLAGGFEPEGAEAAQAPTAGPATPARKGKSMAELKSNFLSVFGHGFGKFGLITAAVVVVLFVGLAVRSMRSEPATKDTAKVDVPQAPQSKVGVDPIDEREAARRAEIAAREADVASKKGKTYQPDFNPAVTADAASSPANQAMPTCVIDVPGQPCKTGQATAANKVEVTVPAGQSSANKGGGAPTTASQQEAARQQAEDRRLQEAEKARQDYIKVIHAAVTKQVTDLLDGKDGEARSRASSTYSSASYLPSRAATQQASTSTTAADTNANPTSTVTKAARRIPIFKAGKVIFATLDAEVNTDDGGEVFATVRGGKYDGAKLIGKIEQAPRNIRLHFTVLAPQDDRETLTISAIAIREEDAKQGVAEEIDNHIIERYAALFAGSTLSGIGKAAMQPQGETIVLPNGQVLMSNPPLSDKRIAMYALGEVGISAGAEVKKTFSEPPTYKTPAKKGIGVIFLADVNDK